MAERSYSAGHLDEIDALYGFEGHRWLGLFEFLAVVRRPDNARLLHSADPDPETVDPSWGWDYDTVEEALDAMWAWDGENDPPGMWTR